LLEYAIGTLLRGYANDGKCLQKDSWRPPDSCHYKREP
jgi:hypothetical protein